MQNAIGFAKSHNRTERDSQGVGRDILISKKLWLLVLQNRQFEYKNKIGQNIPKTILQARYSYSTQKNTAKNT